MQVWITEFMNSYGYWAIALLLAVENIFPPIPSEVILTFGGFMTTYGEMNIVGVVIFSTIGSLLGAILLYSLGSICSAERIEGWLHGRVGKILHLKPEDVQKAQKWFDKRGKMTVFFCRFIPIVRSLISIPAGMAKMHFITFLSLTALGSSIWNIVLVLLGSFAGSSWDIIAEYIGMYSQLALCVLVLLAIGFIIYFIKKNRKHS